MKRNTKQLLLSYMQSAAKNFAASFSAGQLAEHFAISRNLVSQYLNEMVREGILIKAETRPVLFSLTPDYRTRTIAGQPEDDNRGTSPAAESRGPVVERAGNGEYQDHSEKKDAFVNMIGRWGSMQQVIARCQAAMKYPPHGLPILLNGQSGTGKSYLASLLYEYAKEEGLLAPKGKFVILNCSEYANNPELLTSNLFGYKRGAFTGATQDNMGLIQAADGGVLFLDEVHNLSPSCQEKLFLYMDKGIYHLLGDNAHWHRSTARLLFATTKSPEQALLTTLLRRIPVVVQVPSMEERPVQEKEQLIFYFVRRESDQVGMPIKMSYAYFHVLRTFYFRANVGELKSIIRQSCANAYLEAGDADELLLKTYHLPTRMIEYATMFLPENIRQDDPRIIDPAQQHQTHQAEELIRLYDTMLRDFQENPHRTGDSVEWQAKMMNAMRRYYDFLLFGQENAHKQVKIYEDAVEQISLQLCKKYALQLKNNTLLPLARYLYEQSCHHERVMRWEKNHAQVIDAFYDYLQGQSADECAIADDFAGRIEQCLNLSVSMMNRIILILNVHASNPNLEPSRALGVILCHGYSTASSIADVANKMLGEYLFESIDMPIDRPVEEIVEKMQELVKNRHLVQDIVLLVDMGSLEDIHQSLQGVTRMNVFLVNNVTIKMALNLGERIRRGERLQTAVAKVCEENVSTYRMVENRQREKTILFVSETGLENAAYLAELFQKSMTQHSLLNCQAYDFKQLQRNGGCNAIFEAKEVLCIIGTENPEVEDVPFVPLEALICGGNPVLRKILMTCFTEQEMEFFQHNVMHQFALQNVIKYLTILDADKVLNLVTEALENLERECGLTLSPQAQVGLSVHLSCLIERLVKKLQPTYFAGVKDFCQQHPDFIEKCRKSFTSVEAYYGIELPLSEIAYIYMYGQSGIDDV